MSGGEMAEWLGALRELHGAMLDDAQSVGYGTCIVEDPRDFTPDPECSTPEERARWAADCKRAERGEPKETQTRCHGAAGEHKGEQVQLIVTPSGYGLGTYVVRDEAAADYAEQLGTIIGQIEAWRRDR
jgi:hypothetical protein